jgi:tRNA-dihydrouridine synthase C
MDGITDAPMRALVGEWGCFSYSVTEFVRVSGETLPAKVFRREVPEVATDCKTVTGLPVQVQILGGHPERMALSALAAVRAGAKSIDINFGCPSPTVNGNDGGASLLRTPCRIREVVRAVRDALPPEIPVSAKLRLGWESIDDIFENAPMAVEGGAAWLTLHARTRTQRYEPPVFWPHLRRVNELVGVPVVANGDIFSFDDFQKCRETTGCEHFMIGRGALATPGLASSVANALGLGSGSEPLDWKIRLDRLISWCDHFHPGTDRRTLARLKQWLNIAYRHGDFDAFQRVKRTESVAELTASLCKEFFNNSPTTFR